jgi:hypothetical protein
LGRVAEQVTYTPKPTPKFRKPRISWHIVSDFAEPTHHQNAFLQTEFETDGITLIDDTG